MSIDESKIFRPHRGSHTTMTTTKASVVLASGEVFFEYPDAGVGKGACKVKMGDGTTAYSALPYALGSDVSTTTVTYTDSTAATVSAAMAEAASGNTVGAMIAGLKQGESLLNTAVVAAQTDATSAGTQATTNKADIATINTYLATIAEGAEVNQNAISNVKVGAVTVAADAKTDTVNVTGANGVTVTADAGTKTVTVTGTTYANATTATAGLMSSDDKAKLDGVAAGAEVNQFAFSSVTDGTTTLAADAKTDVLNVAAGNGIALGLDATSTKITINGTTYADATQSVHGLMSTTDKTKLDGIDAGAKATVVDSALNATSTNPVQNAVIYAAIHDIITDYNNMVTGGSDAYNTLVELSNYIAQHQDMYTALVAQVATKVTKVDGKDLSTNDFTNDYKTKLDGIAAGAEVNQNAFAVITDGTTSIEADAKSDSLTVAAGNGITLGLNAETDTLTITGTTYSAATTDAAGLMSASDKTKLDGVAAGAEVNQFAFSNVVVGEVTVAAGAKTDSFTLTSANGVTLAADAAAKTVTITGTTYAEATTTTAGLESAADKVLVDTIQSVTDRVTALEASVAALQTSVTNISQTYVLSSLVDEG